MGGKKDNLSNYLLVLIYTLCKVVNENLFTYYHLFNLIFILLL